MADELRGQRSVVPFILSKVEETAVLIDDAQNTDPKHRDNSPRSDPRTLEALTACVDLLTGGTDNVSLAGVSARPVAPRRTLEFMDSMIAWSALTEIRHAASFVAKYREVPNVYLEEGDGIIRKVHATTLIDDIAVRSPPKTAIKSRHLGTNPLTREDITRVLRDVYMEEYALDPTGLALLYLLGKERPRKQCLKARFHDLAVDLASVQMGSSHLHLGNSFRFLRKCIGTWRSVSHKNRASLQKGDFFVRPKPSPFLIPIEADLGEDAAFLPFAGDWFLNQWLFSGVKRTNYDKASVAAKAVAVIQQSGEELWKQQLQELFPNETMATDTYRVFNDRYIAGWGAKSFLGLDVPGDIDFFVVDLLLNRIRIAECKYRLRSERMHEYSSEYKRFGIDGEHHKQLQRYVAWLRNNRSSLRLPGSGLNCAGWEIDGVILTNWFVNSVYAVHRSLEHVRIVFTEGARQFFLEE